MTSILLLFISSVTVFTNLGSALNGEDILGGFLAEKGEFKYQVSIIGKLNHKNDSHLICGGGIISENLVLTAAQCFLDGSGHLRALTFSIAAATNDLENDYCIEKNIQYFFLLEPKASVNVLLNDIAIAQIYDRFGIRKNSMKLSVLDIPNFDETFTNEIAIVTGSGYTWVKTGVHPETGKIYRVEGSTDYKLKFAFVKIVKDTDCASTFGSVRVGKHMCGVMDPKFNNGIGGICTRDTGSPLVINNTVVGIVSRNTPECNDTIHGCVYTQVASYLQFIIAVKDSLRLEGIRYLYNRVHIPEPSL